MNQEYQGRVSSKKRLTRAREIQPSAPISETVPPVTDDAEDAFLAAAREALDPMLEGQALFDAALKVFPPWDGRAEHYGGSDKWAKVGEIYDLGKSLRDNPDATLELIAQGTAAMQQCMQFEADLFSK